MSHRSSRPSFSVVSSEEVSEIEWFDPELSAYSTGVLPTASPRSPPPLPASPYHPINELKWELGLGQSQSVQLGGDACCPAARLLVEYEDKLRAMQLQVETLKGRIHELEVENKALMERDYPPLSNFQGASIFSLLWEIIELGIGVQALCLKNLFDIGYTAI